MEKVNNLEERIVGDLSRNKDFGQVLDERGTIVFSYKNTAHILVLQKNNDGKYDASFSRHTPEIRDFLEY